MNATLDMAKTQPHGCKSQDVGPAFTRAPTPGGSLPAWCVVATYAQAERRAVKNLADQGYPVYLPLRFLRRRDRVIRTMHHNAEAPLFPGYCFVGLGDADPWRPITNTRGVYALLRDPTTGKPRPLRQGVLEAVREAEAVARTRMTFGHGWSPGQPCALDYGAFQDQPAVVLKVGQDMALVSMLMFGELREVAVSLDCLRTRDDA